MGKIIKSVMCICMSAILLCACGSKITDVQTTPSGDAAATSAPDNTNREVKITEEQIMAEANKTYSCISVSAELNISLKGGSEAKPVTDAYTWVINELVLESTAEYKKPVYECTLDLELTNGTVTYNIPGFWDGKSVWKVRFVCPSAGTWTYKTTCSNTADTGLHNITGTVNCKEYTGALDIYKHGFVTTKADTRNFVYADGTPFFYLGDTHWGMAGEKLANFQEVVKKRCEQGFTVIQSEPLAAAFDLADGISATDISGLKKFDEYFFEIADKGLVHANASLFFPSKMVEFIKKYGGYSSVSMGNAIDASNSKMAEMYDINDTVKVELERLCRYWCARYSAFPVMWTLGQEVDNDFYWNATTSAHTDWSYINNPYIYVANYTAKYDAYKSPLSAHQEGMNTTNASQSAFRNVEAHTWYAAQWKWPRFNAMLDFSYQKDYWFNGQGKPCVNYEGYYCYLWTKNMGARAQGWMSYTNGTFGYGWGGQDTWYYSNSYDEDKTSQYDRVDIITPEEKKNATWQDSLEYESTYQMGYMRTFLSETVGDWWNLIPRFDDNAYFVPASSKVLYCCSGNEDNSKIVMYFYNFSDSSIAEIPNSTEAEAKQTGTVKSLKPNEEYVFVWFNPVTGKKTSGGSFIASADGTWDAGEKLTSDMVLYIAAKY